MTKATTSNRTWKQGALDGCPVGGESGKGNRGKGRPGRARKCCGDSINGGESWEGAASQASEQEA